MKCSRCNAEAFAKKKDGLFRFLAEVDAFRMVHSACGRRKTERGI